MRTLKAKRSVGQEPQKWVLKHNQKIVWYTITTLDRVKTNDGTMIAVMLRQTSDIGDPNNDIAALIGNINWEDRRVDLPELWYYNEKFYTKGIDSDGLPYYKNRQYLFHEVEVENPDKIFEEIQVS